MRRDEAKQETRETILAAAERLMARYGYTKMTMGDLAEEAGVGVGTIYLYFPGKADLAGAVLERINRGALERLQQIADRENEPGRRLREMLIARVLLRYEWAREQPRPIEEYARAARDVLTKQQGALGGREAALLGEALRRGRDEGVFGFEDDAATARTLLLATACLMPKNLLPQDYRDPAAMRERVERLVDFLMRALRP